MLYAVGKGVVGKMLPKRCYWEDASSGAFGKMLSESCFFRCRQKDAVLGAIGNVLSERCYRQGASPDAVCCMKKMSPLGAVGETS